MKIKSALLTQASGSIGGMTGSRNRGGMYLRARAIPTNPNTFPQQVARNIFGFVSGLWAGLSDAQREAWSLYGQNVPTTDALGEQITLSGQQWFVGANSLRVRAGVAPVTAAPTSFTRADLTPVSLTAADDTPQISFTFDNTDEWATEVGGGLAVQIGRPQGAGIAFFRGPWLFADTVDGAVVPPTSPATIASPWALTEGQKVWIRLTAFTADGRYSAPQLIGPETVVSI